jgi:hypothetical protein
LLIESKLSHVSITEPERNLEHKIEMNSVEAAMRTSQPKSTYNKCPVQFK